MLDEAYEADTAQFDIEAYKLVFPTTALLAHDAVPVKLPEKLPVKLVAVNPPKAGLTVIELVM